MKLYQVKIRPKSSFITQLQSDTVFGSLCCCIADEQGEEYLCEIIQGFDDGKYPFVVSCWYPEDMLPKPMAGNNFDYKTFNTIELQKAHSKKLKKAKKTDMISVHEFNEIINGNLVELSFTDKKFSVDASTTHNTISRETGGSMESGGLFETYERFYDAKYAKYISLYLAIEDKWIDSLKSAFKLLADRGFGSGASRGKGAFEIISFEPWTSIKMPEISNGHVLLSYYVPKSTESIIGQYKTYIKYGRVGGAGVNGGKPFKTPILMILPGAVFWGNKESEFAVGRLVHNVLSGNNQIVHGGCALALPILFDLPGGI